MDILNEFTVGDMYIRHAIDETPDGRNYDLHIHDKCEIFYFISGSAEYLVEGSVYPLKKGSMLIMRAGEAHCIRILRTDRYERYAINFPLSAFESIDPEGMLTSIYTARELGENNHFHMSGYEDIFEQMCDISLDSYSRQVKIKVGILRILDALNDASNKKHHPPAENSFEAQMLRYINENLFDKLTVDSLAEHFFLSRSQFGRVFKKATGASPWDYITAKRLITAKEMIEKGYTAKKAAEDCGFSDYSSFYRAFVKRFGNSPKG